MLTQRDLSAHRPSVRLVGYIVGEGRRLVLQLARGHRDGSWPLPEQLAFLAAHTGAVF